MWIRREREAWCILAPAKVNLFLEVLGRRSDGYHDIETVMCPITLFDHLSIRATQSGCIELEVATPAVSRELTAGSPASIREEDDDPAWRLPPPEQNLAFRAVSLLLRFLQNTMSTRQVRKGFDGCHIRIQKAIPAAAGLGGGSSDAAAAVCGLLAMLGHWDRQLATEVCQQIGSDVPFFLGDIHGIGLMLATGRGEVCQLIDSQPPLDFVITHPPQGCNTGAIYQRFVPSPTTRDSQAIRSVCTSNDTQKIGTQLFNALQSPASQLNSWIALQLELMSRCGLTHRLMSGSGSSCFALVESPQQVERVESAASASGIHRIFRARAHFAPSIEAQLSSLGVE